LNFTAKLWYCSQPVWCRTLWNTHLLYYVCDFLSIELRSLFFFERKKKGFCR